MIRLSRRKFISFIGLGILSSIEKAMAIEKLQLSDSEWQARLSDEEYYILRKEGTERPGTSVLNFEKRKVSLLSSLAEWRSVPARISPAGVEASQRIVGDERWEPNGRIFNERRVDRRAKE